MSSSTSEGGQPRAEAQPRAAGRRGTELSVVLPAHNEIDLLASTVSDLVAGFSARHLVFEIVVVENGSTDGTVELAAELAAGSPDIRVINLPRGDYGAAQATGFEASSGDVVVFFDVDYYDLAFFDQALSLAEDDGAAIVVASKTAPGASDRRPLLRRLVTLAFTKLLKLALDFPVSDAHGMKLVKRQVLAPVVARCVLRDSVFDVELILRASRSGISVKELPAVVAERRPPRTSIVSRSFGALRDVFRLRSVLRREQLAERSDPEPSTSQLPH